MGWKEGICDIANDTSEVALYAVDPGAYAILQPVAEVFLQKKVAVTWVLEGWAQAHHQGEYLSVEEFWQNVAPIKTVVMGQEVNFCRLAAFLLQARNAQLQTILISDHWKGIAKSFVLDGSDPVYPSQFWVPDEVALQVQKEDLKRNGLAECEFKIVGHPGLEKSIEMVRAYPASELKALRDEWMIPRGEITLFACDPLEKTEDHDQGYDWEDALSLVVRHFQQQDVEGILIVKPHPRQSLDQVKDILCRFKGIEGRAYIVTGAVEGWIKMAERVWGITSLVLVMAKLAGKPIKSFQPHRNEFGKTQTNAHIEPFLVES